MQRTFKQRVFNHAHEDTRRHPRRARWKSLASRLVGKHVDGVTARHLDEALVAGPDRRTTMLAGDRPVEHVEGAHLRGRPQACRPLVRRRVHRHHRELPEKVTVVVRKLDIRAAERSAKTFQQRGGTPRSPDSTTSRPKPPGNRAMNSSPGIPNVGSASISGSRKLTKVSCSALKLDWDFSVPRPQTVKAARGRVSQLIAD